MSQKIKKKNRSNFEIALFAHALCLNVIQSQRNLRTRVRRLSKETCVLCSEVRTLFQIRPQWGTSRPIITFLRKL
jgi:hypothetical protein